MNKLLILLSIFFFMASCVEDKSASVQGANISLEDEDCDDKVKDFGTKDVAEIDLSAPADEGCTIE